MFRAADFFSIEDDNANVLGPTVELSLEIDGVKSYLHTSAVDSYPSLPDLADSIDEFTGSKRWEACNEETVPSLQAEGIDFRNKTVAAQLLKNAISYGNDNVVLDLLHANVEIKVRDEHGETPLMNAAYEGKEVLVPALLTAGADPNEMDKNGYSVLMYGAASGNEQVVAELLGSGAKVNIVSTEGNSALILAASTGNPISVGLLLRAGAAVNVVGEKGNTPLIAAAHDFHSFELSTASDSAESLAPRKVDWRKTVQTLLKAGAEVNVQNEEGQSPLFTNDAGVAEELLAAKALIETQDSHGLTPLLDTNSDIVTKILIDAGANLNATEENGESALVLAADRHNKEKTKVLIESKIDLNLKDQAGNTALMHAVLRGDPEMVKLILDATPDLNARNFEGLTVLGLVRKSTSDPANNEIESLLVGAGAVE